MHKLEGFINIDNDPLVKPDILLDIETDVFPFEDNTVEFITTRHTIEHVHDLTNFFEESYRVLNKDSGKLNIVVPHQSHDAAWADPEHVWFFTQNFFAYLNRMSLGSDGRPLICGNFDYQPMELLQRVTPDAKRKYTDTEQLKFGATYLNNVILEIDVTLKPIFPIRVVKTNYPPTYVRLKR